MKYIACWWGRNL